MKVAINGFGRIGRALLRAMLERRESGFQVVRINDLSSASTLCHLFKYDSVHGRYPGDVQYKGQTLIIDGQEIKLSSEKSLNNLNWGEVDYVCECTGVIQSREELNHHIIQEK